jgi:hypothetical protein
MATFALADGMAEKLDQMYGANAIGDKYMQWVADHGPAWETIVTYVKAQTGESDFRQAWWSYWTDNGTITIGYLLLEGGDFLLLESGDFLELEA